MMSYEIKMPEEEPCVTFKDIGMQEGFILGDGLYAKVSMTEGFAFRGLETEEIGEYKEVRPVNITVTATYPT